MGVWLYLGVPDYRSYLVLRHYEDYRHCHRFDQSAHRSRHIRNYFSKSRHGSTPRQPLRGIVDRGADPRIGAAAAQVARHPVVDIGIGRLRHIGQQVKRLHHLPRLAIAALRDLMVGPGGLHGMERGRGADAFDGGDARALEIAGKGLAGPHGLPVDQHGAGAAQGLAAAVFGAGQPDDIAEKPQKRHVGIGVKVMALAVDGQLHGASPPVAFCDKIAALPAFSLAYRANPFADCAT